MLFGLVKSLFAISITIFYCHFSVANNHIVDKRSTGDNSFNSIKEAINYASNGDTVYIKAGIYTETDILIDKDITIIGHNRNTTILQASYISRAFAGRIFTINEDTQVEISGLTLSNGASDHFGGGILSKGDLKLVNITIKNCYAEAPGGGIAVIGGTCEMVNTKIIDNMSESEGGGIYLNTANMQIHKSEISSNKSKFWGGGIKSDDAALNISNSIIAENRAKGGGGIYVHLTGASFSSVDFLENQSAEGHGNSLHIFTMDQDLSVFLKDCHFNENPKKGSIVQEAFNSKNYLFIDQSDYVVEAIQQEENFKGICEVFIDGQTSESILLSKKN